MNNPFAEFQRINQKAMPIVTNYLEPEVADQEVKEVNRNIENKNIQVMFFGAYNAGKSTIINALLGEEIAKVKDIPTTDRIDFYNWNDFVLIDSPGVNAPIEHEKISEAQLFRSDLIVFVIRQDDQDAKYVYDRMFELIEKNKKIFIILNFQSSTPDDLTRTLDKINEELLKYAHARSLSNDIVRDITIVPINGKTALKGILESKHKLIEHSGFNGFITAFNNWLKLYDNENQILDTIRHQIEKTLINPAIECIETKIGESGNNDVFLLNDRRSRLENQKRVLLQTSHNFIRQEVVQVKPEISTIISSGATQIELESSIQSIAITVSDKVQKWLEQEINDMRVTMIQAIVDKAGIDQNISIDNLNENIFMDKMADECISQLKNLHAENITKLLTFGRKLKIPGLKGRWESTLGKWGQKAEPYIQIAVGLFEMIRASQNQDKENNQKRQTALQLYQFVDQISNSIVSGLSEAVNKVICDIMDEQITAIAKDIDLLTENFDTIATDKQKLLGIRNSLNSVSF